MASPATAHPFEPCGPRSFMLKMLTDKYSEIPVGWGMTENGSVIVELARADDGSFSVFVTWANGKSCMLVSGTGWQDNPLPVNAPKPVSGGGI